MGVGRAAPPTLRPVSSLLLTLRRPGKLSPLEGKRLQPGQAAKCTEGLHWPAQDRDGQKTPQDSPGHLPRLMSSQTGQCLSHLLKLILQSTWPPMARILSPQGDCRSLQKRKKLLTYPQDSKLEGRALGNQPASPYKQEGQAQTYGDTSRTQSR